MAVAGAGDELRRVRIFSRVDPAELMSLESAAFVRRLARGQVLFVAGEPAEHVHVLRSGSLKVHVGSEQGGELVLAILGPGHSLGEISVVDGGSRSADVTALAASELLTVPTAAVRDLLDRSPAAMRAVAVMLAAGMRRLTQQAADLVFLDLPRRLAKLLLDSAVDDADGRAVVQLPGNQSELAAMLGVTRQSLNRALSALTTRGWIEPAGASIRLRDHAALTRFVHT